MPIVPGIQIRMPGPSARAASIIKSMQTLLEARRELRVSRRAFLAQWRKLRKALFLTKDYQQLRLIVWNRCKGVCEECNNKLVAHVHHEQRVALDPSLALNPSNCRGLCRGCHSKQPEH